MKGHRVLTAGNIHVRRDARISLRGTDLQILSKIHGLQLHYWVGRPLVPMVL